MDDNKNDQNSPTQNNLLGDNDRTTIGQYLRAKREKKNLTIKHIAQFTKINTTQVELLEKDLLHKLPNRAYVAGYVKAYAKAIGLPQDEALRYLDKTYRDQAPEVPAAPLKIEPKETAATAYVAPEEKQRKISKEAIVLMGVAGVMVAVTSLTLLFKKEPQKVVDKIVPESEMQAQPTVTPTPMMTKIPVQTPTLVPKIITTLTPTFTPTQTPTKAPTIAPTPTAVPTVSEKSTSTQTIIKEQIKIFPDIEFLNTQDQFSSPLQRPSEKKEENSSKVQEEPITKKEEIKEEKKDEKKDEKKKSNFFKIRVPLYQVLKNSDLSDKIPTNIRHAVAPGKQNVYITTGNGRTWITYKVDKEPIKQIFLKENAAVLLSGSEVRLFLGNAAAANVYLNNNPVDMQLKRGIKNLVFPESSISKFAVPLFIFDEQGTISPSDEYMKKKGLTPN